MCETKRMTSFAMPVYAQNAIILPSQARDKHRETPKREMMMMMMMRFSLAGTNPGVSCGACSSPGI